jgi:hypothetical protein
MNPVLFGQLAPPPTLVVVVVCALGVNQNCNWYALVPWQKSPNVLEQLLKLITDNAVLLMILERKKIRALKSPNFNISQDKLSLLRGPTQEDEVVSVRCWFTLTHWWCTFASLSKGPV